MHKFKVLLILYLMVSTEALNIPTAPDFSSSRNAGFHHIPKDDVEEGSGSYQEITELLADIPASTIHLKTVEPTLVRQKRQVVYSQTPDLLFTVLSPMLEEFIQRISSTLLSGPSSLFNGVLVPLMRDILTDRQSMYDVKSLIVLAQAAFSPLFMELMATQSWNTPEGTVIKIPRHIYEAGVTQLRVESRPIVRRLLEKYVPKSIYYKWKNSRHIVNLMDRLMWEKYDGAELLMDQYFAFLKKHRGLFKQSTNKYVYYYPINVISRDFASMAMSATKVLFQFLRRNPNHWLNKVYNENKYFLNNLGVGTPTYVRRG